MTMRFQLYQWQMKQKNTYNNHHKDKTKSIKQTNNKNIKNRTECVRERVLERERHPVGTPQVLYQLSYQGNFTELVSWYSSYSIMHLLFSLLLQCLILYMMFVWQIASIIARYTGRYLEMYQPRNFLTSPKSLIVTSILSIISILPSIYLTVMTTKAN